MTQERYLEDDWPTHLVNPEILFTDRGMAQAERVYTAAIAHSVAVRRQLDEAGVADGTRFVCDFCGNIRFVDSAEADVCDSCQITRKEDFEGRLSMNREAPRDNR